MEVDFGNAFSDEDAFLELAQTFEDTGVSAYNGAATDIESKELLATAGTTVQVEAPSRGGDSPPARRTADDGAFDETLSMDKVLKAVNPYVRA